MNCLMNLLLPLVLSGLIAYIILARSEGEAESADTRVTRERLRKIKNKTYDMPNKQKENKLAKQIVTDSGYKYKLLGKNLEKYKFIKHLKLQLKMADVKTDVSQFLFMMIMIFCVVTVIGVIMKMGMMAVIMGLGIGIGFPMFRLKMKQNKRLNRFTQQLPEALGLIASSLRAGHSLLSAFNMVGAEMPEPVAGVFRTACEEMNLGRSIKEALDAMQEAVPGSIDLRFFVTAVLIQREVGGNLAEILDSLNSTIRERFKLLGQIKAQTAQASLSGLVLACAPAAIGGIIYLLNPNYMKPLFEHPLGKVAIGVAVFFGVLGFLIIKKITNIRV